MPNRGDPAARQQHHYQRHAYPCSLPDVVLIRITSTLAHEDGLRDNPFAKL
jgi:hypothetical protein